MVKFKIMLEEEKKLLKKGFQYIAGIDEAGRGCIAGPVVAGIVCLNYNFIKERRRGENFIRHLYKLGLKDSKKISPQKREYFFRMLSESKFFSLATGSVSEKIIDSKNIFEATKLAMKKALKNLLRKEKEKAKKFSVDFLIIDGNFFIDAKVPQKPIISADERVFLCISASIVAKVTRDRMMMRYHKIYNYYGFDKHKGYFTKLHLKALKKYGPCPLHRQSFSPVAKIKKIC